LQIHTVKIQYEAIPCQPASPMRPST
jgi:hypothetical protein